MFVLCTHRGNHYEPCVCGFVVIPEHFIRELPNVHFLEGTYLKLPKFEAAMQVGLLSIYGLAMLVGSGFGFSLRVTTAHDADYFYAKSDDELHNLHAPFREIIEQVNLEYGVEIIPASVHNPFFTDERRTIAETLAYVTLEEHERQTVEFAVSLRSLLIRNAVLERLFDLYFEGYLPEIDFIDFMTFVGVFNDIFLSTQCIIPQVSNIFGEEILLMQNTEEILSVLSEVNYIRIMVEYASSLQEVERN